MSTKLNQFLKTQKYTLKPSNILSAGKRNVLFKNTIDQHYNSTDTIEESYDISTERTYGL